MIKWRLKSTLLSSSLSSIQKDNDENIPYLVTLTFPAQEKKSAEALGEDMLDIEIKNTIFSMPPMEAPGIDDLHAIFFQSQWDLVGPSVCKLIK